MLKPIDDKPPLPVMPADRAANSSIWFALGSVAAFWLGVFFTNFAGILAFLAGLVVWLGTWTASVGLAIGAIRNSFSSATPSRTRTRAIAALVFGGAGLVVVCFFIFSLLEGIRRLQ